ncbi:MAG: hypothetical protein R3A78_14130 [Polyangiales bacterium]
MWIGAAGWIYGGIALVMGIVFAGLTLEGLRAEPPANWARRVFFASLAYLPVVFVALMLDAG